MLPAFNPEVHPAILFRSVLMGLPVGTVADIIGIPQKLLTEWINEHPELREAVSKADAADANVLASLYYAAVGWCQYSSKPVENGPSVSAARLWLKHRQDWHDRKEPPPPSVDKMNSEQVLERLAKVERLLGRPAGSMARGPIIDTHVEEEDVGF